MIDYLALWMLLTGVAIGGIGVLLVLIAFDDVVREAEDRIYKDEL